ncbi:MAG: hypothetical protein LBR80_08600 [Deltaproteobacteria bacterium]|jgi:biotin carboxylase|nr:hypothetical protein [Deltaproteobacteria bacterium]
MPRKLLVLGASRYQLPVIRKAREMGLTVLTADNAPSNPGHAEADLAFSCDTTDAEGIASLAASEAVSGIIAPSTDVALPALALACSRLGLPGPGEEAATILTRKASFRALQRELGLPHPPFAAFSGPFWPKGLDPRCGPWAMKPNVSSGSKGVFMADGPEEFGRLAPETLRHSLDGTGVLEAWVKGTQHTCEGILHDGVPEGVMMTDRVTAPPPWAATWGHFSPAIGLSPGLRMSLLSSLRTVFDRLELRQGTFDCDFVAPESGKSCIILEATPRLGGNSLSSLYRTSMKADIERYAVCHAVGLPQDFNPEAVPQDAGVMLFGVLSRGKLSFDREAAANLPKEPWVLSFEMDLPYGAQVEPFANGRCRVGEALITGDSPGTTRKLASIFRARLDVKAV